MTPYDISITNYELQIKRGNWGSMGNEEKGENENTTTSMKKPRRNR
jgi:hypothetical protein